MKIFVIHRKLEKKKCFSPLNPSGCWQQTQVSENSLFVQKEDTFLLLRHKSLVNRQQNNGNWLSSPSTLGIDFNDTFTHAVCALFLL